MGKKGALGLEEFRLYNMPKQEEETAHVSCFTCIGPLVSVWTPELGIT